MNSTYMPGSTPFPQEFVVAFLNNIQLARYFEIAPVTILYLDHFLTLPDEIKYIWKGEWSIVTFLFLFTKYFAMLDSSIVLILDFIPNLTATRCGVLWHLTAWSYLVGLNIAEMIFTRRTIALWTDRPWIGRTVWTFNLLTLPVGGWLVERVVLSVQFIPSLVNIYSGCFTARESNGLWITYAILLCYETVLFVLTVPKVRYQREDRKHLGGKPLSYVIYRDGFQFYVYLLIVSVINIVGLVTLKGSLAVSITRIHRVLHAILAVRLVINLRKAMNDSRHSSGSGGLRIGSGRSSGGEKDDLEGMEFAALDVDLELELDNLRTDTDVSEDKTSSEISSSSSSPSSSSRISGPSSRRSEFLLV